MLPAEARVAGLQQLIDEKFYFVVHAPRQVGKTTSLLALAESLTTSGRYAALHTSCEVGQKLRPDLEGSIQGILEILFSQARRSLPVELCPPEVDRQVSPESRLHDLLSRWAERCPRPVVLFLDEIDALYDDALLSVLRQLRSGFHNRPESFPQSVALVGLRDVRDYKIVARNFGADGDGADGAVLGTASPFNIKSDSLRLPNFTAAEVADLYGQHTADTGQIFDEAVKVRAFELTQGQPWLVNALARQLVETVVPDRARTITADDLDLAKEILIRRRDTHLDSLLDRLREPRVRRILEPILAGGVPGDAPEITDGPDPDLDDDLQFAKDLGLVAVGERGLEIANPIYREIIPRALTSAAEHYVPMRRAAYVRPDGTLDWQALLDGFVSFWQQNAEWMLRRQPYSEAAAQLVFMAFLHRLVNGIDLDAAPESRLGVATVDREFAVGSGRIDLLVRWPVPGGPAQRFAVELKVRRDGDRDPLADGLLQLTEYLDRLDLDHGTLLLFDLRSAAPPIPERCSKTELEQAGRTFTVLRV